MKIKLSLALAILTLSILSCTITIAPTQPTPTVPEILASQNFAEAPDWDRFCSGPCVFYKQWAQGEIVSIYPNGSMSIALFLSSEYNRDTQGKILGNVIVGAFGNKVGSWVAKNMQKAINSGSVSTTIGINTITIAYYPGVPDM